MNSDGYVLIIMPCEEKGGAEKQFRFPLELGTQRPQTAQWTITGSGAVIVSKTGIGPFITHITPR